MGRWAALGLALVLVLVLVLVPVHLGRAGPLCASCLAFVAILAPKPKGPVLENTLDKAVATPTDKRGFVTPKFWGPVRPHRSPLVLGGMAEAVTPGAWLYPCFQHPAHLLRLKTQMVALESHKGAKRMTHVTQGQTTPTQSPQTAPLDRIAMGLPASAASAVHHAALAEEAAKPNLQKLSMEFEVAGFNHDLIFCRNQVQSLASRLRGISAIGAVLSAGTWGDAVDIGGTLQAGLLDALNSLVKDAYQEIELTDVHACEAQEEAKRQGGAA